MLGIVADELTKLTVNYRVDPLKLDWPGISYEYRRPLISDNPLAVCDLHMFVPNQC